MPKPTRTIKQLAEEAEKHGLRLVDDKYNSVILNYTTSQAFPRHQTAETVFMCSCGWASKRFGCPHHA